MCLLFTVILCALDMLLVKAAYLLRIKYTKKTDSWP